MLYAAGETYTTYSYLTNRKIIVNVNGSCSAPHDINISVPQGSVLGPILYLLYVNDMCKLGLKGKLRMFADDTSTFYASKHSFGDNMDNISSDMVKIKEFYRINRLTLNLTKTHYMNFGQSKSASEYSDGINCEGTEIQHSDHLKFLGLHIDKKLTWAKHIDCTCAKVSGAAGALRKLHFLPKNILRKLYFALVHPHLQYAAAIWSHASQTHVNKLQIIQRMAIKSCYKLSRRFGTEALFCDVAKTILPVKAIGIMQTCTIVHAALHKQTRTNFEFKYEERRRTTRRPIGLEKIRVVVKTYGESAIKYAGPCEYNKLPPTIRGTNKLQSFKRQLKKHLLSVEIIKNYLR